MARCSMARQKGTEHIHVPTEKDRLLVKVLAGIMGNVQIANAMNINRSTLEKYYKEELIKGKDYFLSQALFGLMGNIKKGKEASIFFYLKTQHGWREKSDYEIDTQGKTITISLAPDPQSNARKRNKLD